MTDPDARAGRAAVPTIPYRNLPKMIDWLCQAFGFQRQLIVFDESGSIAHGQLALGGSVVMVVPAGQGPFEDVLVHPDQVERIATQSTYLLVDDVETRHARATESGAEIMFEMEFNNAAGRGYACRDPEGHIWLFGSYDPWLATTKHAKPVANKGFKGRAAMLAALAFASLVLVGWISWQTGGHEILSARPWNLDVGADDGSAALDAAQDARRAAERRATDLADRLAREEVAHKKEVGASMEARNALARDLTAKGEEAKQAKLRWQQERDARIAVERAGKEASQLLERERAGRMAADLAVKEAQQNAARERAARVNTERQAQEAIGQVLQERSARAAAELAANELRNQLLLSRGADGKDKLPELRGQLLAERQARDALERAAQEAQEQLVRERTSRHNAERALQQTQQAQSSAPLSCWSCPAGTACDTSR
jgi:uncharacterized glyoxalase superfamily protein PhnB